MNIVQTTLAGHVLEIKGMGAISTKRGKKVKKGKFSPKTKIEVSE